MKLLVANDPHISDRAPESRVDNYMESICLKLSEIVGMANDNGVSALIFTGDFFHYKDPRRSSHRLVNHIIKILRECKSPVFIVPGNHDLEGGSIQSLDEQPIGVLIHAGVIKLVDHERFLAGSRQVVVSFHPHVYGVPDHFLTEIESQQRDPESIYIEAVHAGIVPHGSPIYEDMMDLETMWHRGFWHMVCSGHIHNDLGILYHNETGRYFANVGAVSRGTIAESNLTRIPQVLLVDVNDSTGKITPTPLVITSARPSSEVFSVQEYRDKKELAQRFDAFVHFVGQQMEVTHKKTLEQIIEDFFVKMNVDMELRKEVMRYLSQAS